jgi:multisubunit Na+/H+ antiporter MnhB subunit
MSLFQKLFGFIVLGTVAGGILYLGMEWWKARPQGSPQVASGHVAIAVVIFLVGAFFALWALNTLFGRSGARRRR